MIDDGKTDNINIIESKKDKEETKKLRYSPLFLDDKQYYKELKKERTKKLRNR